MATSAKPRKRIWVLNVDVDADELGTRLEAARAGGFDPSQEAIAEGVSGHISSARNAANRKDPIPGRWLNWWRGALVEAAYRHLHAARAQMVDLFDENELEAEIPVAVARAQTTLQRDDPYRVLAEGLNTGSGQLLRPRLRRLMDESYEVLDSAHAQLRSFRNILLLSAAVITALVVITIVFVHRDPTVMPFCFPNEIVIDSEPVVTEAVGQNCPTASATTGPSGDDIMMVALLGALGGALAASASIRNLKGTSTAYDVPVALAFLKLPLGAFTAILGLVAIRGDFVPGLSVLDSQEQILAYALIFGFAQQILTRLLDQRAQTLVEELPGGTAVKQPPTTARPGAPVAGTEPSEAKVQPPETGALADLPYQDVEVVSSEKPVDAEPEDDNETLAPVVAEDEVAITDPLADQGDQLQEDEIPSDPEVPPDDVPTQRR